LTECTRIVHDESFPRSGGMSVNTATTNNPLEIHHDGVTHIAQLGLEAASRYPEDVVMMTGDVAGAFRHMPFNCWFCGYFSGYIPELDLIVVNLNVNLRLYRITGALHRGTSNQSDPQYPELGILRRSHPGWRRPPV
jgi:hypothetical protein